LFLSIVGKILSIIVLPVDDEPGASIVLAFCLIVIGTALLLSGIVAFGFHRNSLHSMALL
jgi:hypothetical protein